MLRLIKRTFRPVRVDALPPSAEPLDLDRALRRPLFFCHVPKTAGTTLRSFLEQHYPAELICSARDIKLQQLEAGTAMTAAHPAFVYAHYNALPLLNDSFRLISVLRDPVERVRSLYRHWGQFSEYNLVSSPAPERTNELKRLSRSMPLAEFLRIDEWPVQRHFHNGLAKSLVPGFDHKTAHRFSDRGLVDAAVETLHSALCVGVTDRFDDFVRLVCFHMHWPPPRAHQPLNVRSESRETAADDGLDAIISPHTRLDHEVFQQGQRIFDQQFAAMQRALSAGAVQPSDAVDADALDHVLDERARRALIEAARNRRPPASVVFDMRMPLRGAGWLEREGMGLDRPYRWTGPGCESTVDCIIARADRYVVRLRVVSVIHDDILDGCALTLNGMQARSTSILQSENCRELHAEFAGDAVGTDCFARLVMTVPRTATHLEVLPECGDSRRKGLAIERITLEART